jgi:small conductance mechanosensitive channel
MVSKYIRVLARLICVGLLALFLILFSQSPVLAQFTGLGLSEDDISSPSYVPVFTRGNLDIAPVFLDGKLIGTVSSFIKLELNKDDNQSISHDAATRSHLIHSKMKKILNTMTRYSYEVFPQQGIFQPEEQEKELRKQLVTNFSEKKGSAFVSVTFPQDDVPETIYSVTQADISRPRFGNSQPLEIAEVAAKITENTLIQAWKERQKPHLLAQAQQALLVLLALICTSLSLWWGQKHLVARQRELKESLSNSKTAQLQDNWISGLSKVTVELNQQFQKLYLRQRQTLNALYRSVLFWTQWLLWMIGIGYLTSLFYWSRPFSNWIVGVTILNIRAGAGARQILYGWPPVDWVLSFGREATLGTPIMILMLLLVTRLSLKVGDALSDFFAGHLVNAESESIQRHQLRAPTLAKAFKGWLRAIVYLLLAVTVVYHLHQLGTITQLVAVLLGFFSFALSLASQDEYDLNLM